MSELGQAGGVDTQSAASHQSRARLKPMPAIVPYVPRTTTALPDGLIVFDSDRSGTFQLYVMNADGGHVTQLTNDPTTDAWWPRLSPDRKTIIFYRTPAGVHDQDYSQASLWSIASTGTNPVELRPAGTDGWAFQGHADWSPDGTHLVMFGGAQNNPQIEITTASGTDPVAVTKRGGTNIDPSYSPDGRTIVFVGCPQSQCYPANYEVYTIPVAGGVATRITNDSLPDYDPSFSPDGTRISWLTQSGTAGAMGTWGIRTANSDGSSMAWVINDGAVNSKPQWSDDGSSIYFHRLVPGAPFAIYSIHVDGSGLTKVSVGRLGNDEYPSV